MYQLMLNLVKIFHIICVVITYSVSNSNIFEFALLRNSSFWKSNKFFKFVLKFDQYFNVL
jgi:hypothetical protein